MDLKTQKRIAQFKAKQREQRQRQGGSKEPLTEAQRAVLRKRREAKQKRPGFGSSVSSVADHLNEVVGLTDRKISKREERDRRIEQAAKEGHGCRRFEVAASRAGTSKFNGVGRAIAPVKPRPRQPSRRPGTLNTLGGGSPSGPSGSSNQARMQQAREAFLARLEANKQPVQGTE
mmetsp:Transcript_19005/g.48054  ORF Transcript_19005/g.48054 Transcript_19005/m.48054 type:complete len:175 (+) Transcript_19005:104-628(+)